MFNGGTGPLNEKLVERVESSVKDFIAENQRSRFDAWRFSSLQYFVIGARLAGD